VLGLLGVLLCWQAGLGADVLGRARLSPLALISLPGGQSMPKPFAAQCCGLSPSPQDAAGVLELLCVMQDKSCHSFEEGLHVVRTPAW